MRKWINKNHEVMLAELADRLEEADKLTDCGMPFTSALLLQTQGDPHMQRLTCSFYRCLFPVFFSPVFFSSVRPKLYQWFTNCTYLLCRTRGKQAHQ